MGVWGGKNACGTFGSDFPSWIHTYVCLLWNRLECSVTPTVFKIIKLVKYYCSFILIDCYHFIVTTTSCFTVLYPKAGFRWSSLLVLPHIMCKHCQWVLKRCVMSGGNIFLSRYSTISISNQHIVETNGKSSSVFHTACEELSVYPGLKLCCYLRVWIPSPSQSSWQGSWERGPEADLLWRGHKQKCAYKECLLVLS